MQPIVSVVHLVWMPYGIQLFKDFLNSYKSYESGYPHQLILLFNGISNKKDAAEYHSVICDAEIPYQSYYYEKGQDLEAYRWIANQLTSDYIFFLNSYSRLLAVNWLIKFVKVLNEDVGIVGATASWQSYYSTIFTKYSWQWTKSFSMKQNIAKYKLMLKALIVWRRYFKPFPNPHIRTNGFLIRRNLFLNFKYQNPKTKLDAYRIESGRRSITNQAINAGLKVFLLDKYGNSFEPASWNSTKVFWNANQEELLISDNQTEVYATSDNRHRKLLKRLAWGEK